MFAFNWGFNNFNIMPNPFMGGGCCCHHNRFNPYYNGYNNSGLRFAMGMPLFMSMLSGQRTTNPFMQELMQPNFYEQIPVPNYYTMPNYNNVFSNFNMNYNPTPASAYANFFESKYNELLNSVNANNTSQLNFTTTSSVNNTVNSSAKASNSQSIVDTGKIDKNFLNKVKQVAQNLNCDYRDLLAVINSESGFNPRAGAGTKYVGLIQFGEYAIQDLRNKAGCTGLTKEKILNMSPIEQMDLVEKMVKIGKKYGKFPENARLSGGDLYAIVFAPCRSGNEVLYRKGEAGYNSINANIDYNKDGKITKSEMSERIRRKYVNESIFA